MPLDIFLSLIHNKNFSSTLTIPWNNDVGSLFSCPFTCSDMYWEWGKHYLNHKPLGIKELHKTRLKFINYISWVFHKLVFICHQKNPQIFQKSFLVVVVVHILKALLSKSFMDPDKVFLPQDYVFGVILATSIRSLNNHCRGPLFPSQLPSMPF